MEWHRQVGIRATVAPAPYAAPARAADLSGLPPAFVDAGSAETFRDEDVAYASRIWQAGGQAELHVWPGKAAGRASTARGSAISMVGCHSCCIWTPPPP